MAKTSITMPEHILAAMDGRSHRGAGEDRSSIIWRSLARYLAIISRAKLDMAKRFDRQECALILDACNGTAFMDTISIQLLPAGVEDAIEMDGLDKKWQVDGAELMRKLNSLSYAERMALVDAISLWWDRVSNAEQPDYAELLTIPPFDKDTSLVL